MLSYIHERVKMDQSQHDAIRKIFVDFSKVQQLIIDLEKDITNIIITKEQDNDGTNT